MFNEDGDQCVPPPNAIFCKKAKKQYHIPIIVFISLAVLTIATGIICDMYIYEQPCRHVFFILLICMAVAMPFIIFRHFVINKAGFDFCMSLALLLYVLFLIIADPLSGPKSATLVEHLQNSFKSLGEGDVTTTEEFWTWIFAKWQPAVAKLLGDGKNSQMIPWSMKQNRVKKTSVARNSLEIGFGFPEMVYGEWDPRHEDKEPLVLRDKTTIEYWDGKYQVELNMRNGTTNTVPAKSSSGRQYPGSGYIAYFHFENSSWLETLRDNDFIDVSTRAVTIDCWVLNANMRAWGYAAFLFEFYPSGLISVGNLWVISGNIYDTGQISGIVQPPMLDNYLALWVFILLGLIEIFQTLIVELSPPRNWSCLYSGWNFLTYMSIAILFVTFATAVQLTASVPCPTCLIEYRGQQQFSAHWESSARIIMTLRSYIGFEALLGCLRSVGHLKLSESFRLLPLMIEMASADLVSFFFVLAIIFIGYSLCFFVNFSAVSQFRSFDSTVFSLFRAMVGNLDTENIFAADRVLGPLLYCCFAVTMIFIMLTVIIGILSEALKNAKKSIKGSQPESLFDDPPKKGISAKLQSLLPSNRTYKRPPSRSSRSVNVSSMASMVSMKPVSDRSEVPSPSPSNSISFASSASNRDIPLAPKSQEHLDPMVPFQVDGRGENVIYMQRESDSWSSAPNIMLNPMFPAMSLPRIGSQEAILMEPALLHPLPDIGSSSPATTTRWDLV